MVAGGRSEKMKTEDEIKKRIEMVKGQMRECRNYNDKLHLYEYGIFANCVAELEWVLEGVREK